jgi:AcrR family transcriptional regulator
VARTATITTDQILSAARAVFLEHGINATTVDVANRAGISSASIFKHFPTKDALFFAAMSEAPGRIWNAELEAAIGHGDPKADLLLIANRIAAFTKEIFPRLMMLRSVGQLGGQGPLPSPPRMEEDFIALTTYLGREMALGRIARGDPTVPALALMHANAGYAMNVAVQSSTSSFDTSGFLEDFVLMLWQGLEPRGKSG